MLVTTPTAAAPGAFAWADSTGILLLAPADFRDPERLTTAVCRGGRRLPVEFVRRQEGTGVGDGRDWARSFSTLEGTVFRILEGRLEPNENCLLATDSLLTHARFVRVTKPRDAHCCDRASRKRFAKLRSRPVFHCWPIARVGSDEVALVEFERRGRDALASLVLVGPWHAILEDFPSDNGGDPDGVWRASDAGDLSPEGFDVLFAWKSPRGWVMCVSWGAEEGEDLMLLVSRDGRYFTEMVENYRYLMAL